MIFTYSQYLRACLVVPFLLSLFVLIIFFELAAQIFAWIRKKEVDRSKVLPVCGAVLICGFMLGMNLGTIYSGGMHLVYERESDAITIQGVIGEMEDLGRFSFPKIKTEYGYPARNGVRFFINGAECIAPTNGALNIGDDVLVTYLPESGYVLSIFPK